MPVRVTCPGCKASFALADNLCGQTVRCTKCQRVFRVGQAPAAAPAPAAVPVAVAVQAAAPAKPAAPPPPAAIPNLSLDDVRGEEAIPVLKPAEPASPRAPAPKAAPASKRDTSPDDFDMQALFGSPASPEEQRQAVQKTPASRGSSSASSPRGGDTSTDDFDVPAAPRGARPRRGRDDHDPDDEPGMSQQTKIIIGSSVGGGILILTVVIAIVIGNSEGGPPRHDEPFAHVDEKRPIKIDDKRPIDRPPPDHDAPKVTPLPPGAVRAVGPMTEPAPQLGVTPLDGPRVERRFPQPIEDLAVGGGGRYLVLSFGRQMTVFDLNTGQSEPEDIRLPQGKYVLAAGMHQLIAAQEGGTVLYRYNLATRQLEAQSDVRFASPVASLTMGSASNGPLLIAHKDGSGSFLDPATFKPVVPDMGVETMPGVLPHFARASADGRTFTWRSGGGEPHENCLVRLQADRAEKTVKWISGSITPPSPDGGQLYGVSAIFNERFDPVWEDQRRPPSSHSYVPAVHGPWYMQLDMGPERWGDREQGATVRFFLPNESAEFANLANVEGACRENISHGDMRHRMTPDKRVMLFPAASVLVTVPAPFDKLILHRFNPEAALKQSNLEYLAVTSRPPAAARKGQPFRYQLSVLSRNGGLKYQLASGPEGMKVTEDGLVAWDVAPGLAMSDVGVAITVRDARGKEAFHRFRLAVAER